MDIDKVEYNKYSNTTKFIYFVNLIGLIGIALVSETIYVMAISFSLFIILILQYVENNKLKKIIDYILLKKDEIKEDLDIDNITGLPNKNALFDELKYEYVMIVSIDKFDEINSVYGLKNSNLILKKLSDFLKSILNDDEKVYYFQNDCFVILFEKTYYEELIKKIYAEKLEIVIDNNILIKIDLTIAVSLEHSNQINNALNALRYARKYYKSYVVYSNDLNIEKNDKEVLEWIDLVKYSLEDDEVIPYCQSIVDKNGNLVSYEVLMRIKQVNRVIIPEEFLDKVKSTKYYKEMSKRIIYKSFKFFEGKDITFSVNLSILDIADNEMQEFIIKYIKRFNIGHKVIFEITEDEAIEDFEIVKKFLEKMKRYSVRIAIDNFGNGYTNFLHLKELDIDYLKIDSSIIRNIAKDFDTQNIITNILDLAHKMDIITVAEYVSNESIFEVTKELGVDSFQGYYFSKPENMLKLDKKKDLDVETIID